MKTRKSLVVLSLFDGISCGRLALQRANLPIKAYLASEIDDFASSITNYHFPDTIQLGDVTKWKTWKLPWKHIDLVLSGSPCQGFSYVGKMLNFHDSRSSLFFEFYKILKFIKKQNPNVKFLFENVVMKKEWANIITQLLKVEPILINSALVSAQYRPRLYWFNWECPQPEDKKIFINDVFGCKMAIDVKFVSSRPPKIYFDKVRTIMTNCSTLRFGWFKPSKKEIKKLGLLPFETPWGATPGIYYRLLRPEDCEVLQTIPIGYTGVFGSKGFVTKRSKALGNAWTVDVIAHILRHMPCSANK